VLKKWNLVNYILGIIDIVAIAAAFQFAYMLNYSGEWIFFFTERIFLYMFLGVLPLWLLILYLLNITEIPRTKRYRAVFMGYLKSAIIFSFLFLLYHLVFKITTVSQVFILEFVITGFIFLFVVRLFEYKFFKIYRSKGYNQINAVLIADDSSLTFIEKLLEHKEWGYRIFAIFTESEILKEKYEKSIILLPGKYLSVLHDLMEVDLIDEVLYFKNKIITAEVRETARSCEELGVTFKLRHKDSKLNLTNAIKTEIDEEAFLTFINIPHNPYPLAIKKIMDVVISLLLIIIFSPFLIVLSMLIKLTSPGPIIFKQARVGLRGRQFSLYKFRTMVVNAEEIKKELEAKNEMDGPVFKIKDDPRITKVGKFLRKTGLDELPQLFNVLKGEMSLIGPRPPLQSETIQYKRWQLRRLSVKPGLSCFWQIKPNRNSIKFEQWMEMDLAYIDNWSPRLDFVILLKTIKTVFQRSGI
jgi:exopolysaccharide biosynthesis polyprenyl glycosylphosphotransferase